MQGQMMLGVAEAGVEAVVGATGFEVVEVLVIEAFEVKVAD